MDATPELDDVVRLLKASHLFDDVPDDDLIAFAKGFAPRTFTTGEVVVKEGERGREIFLIVDGEFEVISSEAEGSKHLDTIGPSAIFGEMAALTGGRRFATVRAATDSRVLVIEEPDFHVILRASRPLSEAILRSLDRYA